IVEDGIIKKEGFFESELEERKDLRFPKDHVFGKEIYEYALTQDQVDFIKLIEKLIKKPDPVTAVVLKSHRGRGKSSAIGIALPALIENLLRFKRRVRVIITAPELENVQEIFRFSEKIIREKGYELRKRDREGLVFNISSENFTIEYFKPADAIERYADIIIVDEAASIPPNLLLSLLDRTNRIIYSSTVHGYEGAGRSFSIRFLQRLKKKNVKILEFEMVEPIRYSINDPIERWIFDTLLLDAEAPDINVDHIDDLIYEKLKIEDLLENEDKLREYFGILILAHYKNNPNDFAILCDAPNHVARAMSYNGKIVCSMQIAYEGNLRNEDCKSVYYGGKMILGNVIPQLMIRHYREMKYGKYKGMRVVRIAVHPDNFDKGIGSKALENILKEAEEERLDYVGASFGATSKLIRFWLKNGFLPMHISTTRNDVSAEFSVTVIKSLNKDFGKELKAVRKKFIRRFMYWLFEPLRDLNSKVALDILESYEGENIDLGLDREEINRLLAYAFDVGLTYRTVKDCIFKMSYNFFLSNRKNVLSRNERMLLLVKNIQCKSWERTAEILDINEERCKVMMRRIVERLIFEFYGDRDEVLEFQEEVQRIFAERQEDIDS
ncbi:MAG TPA: tRNA(Met) cytidine acetyltransferase, partial [Thermoplasmatales archaeon]|nr:tRNA(Met) cytidine acetyltransferase [Thermoplasmatales archaeon]